MRCTRCRSGHVDRKPAHGFQGDVRVHGDSRGVNRPFSLAQKGDGSVEILALDLSESLEADESVVDEKRDVPLDEAVAAERERLEDYAEAILNLLTGTEG